jgi:hypothetical protein
MDRSDSNVVSSACWAAAIPLGSVPEPGTAMELSGIELSGIELSGDEARPMELSGMELRGADAVSPDPVPVAPETLAAGMADAGTVSTPATVCELVPREADTGAPVDSTAFDQRASLAPTVLGWPSRWPSTTPPRR